jgi:two-component system chemotaxis sensor kinase CheA
MMLTSEMVDACLQSKDVLSGMLAAHRGATAVDPGSVADVERRLAMLVDGGSQLAADAVTTAMAAKPADLVSRHTLYVELDHLPGVDYEALLQSLAALGEMTVLQQVAAISHSPGCWFSLRHCRQRS